MVSLTLLNPLFVRIDLLAQSTPLDVLVAIDFRHALPQVVKFGVALFNVNAVFGCLAASLPYMLVF